MTDETPEIHVEGTDRGKASNQPVSPSAPPSFKPDIQQDMARILQGVQLPERRGGLAAALPKKIESKVIPPIPQNEPEPTTPPKEEGALTAVHTFKDDLTRVARDQKISVVKAISLEEEKRHREKPQDFDGAVQKNSLRPFIIGSVVLTALGVLALVAVVLISSQQKPAEVAVTTTLLFAEQANSFPLTQESGMDIKRILLKARDQNATLGSFTQIIPTIPAESRKATAQEFLEKLDTHAPEGLIRSLGTDFFLGIHTVDINAPVLVFSIDSYENAFENMLKWEQDVGQDLQPFFTGTSALTSKDGTPMRRTFTDEIIKNYDIRALHDDSGKIVMYYAFPSRSILIIAESPFSFIEIVTRLKAQRAL